VNGADVTLRHPQDKLPIGVGTYPYEPPSGGPSKEPHGRGYRDRRGNVWEWRRSNASTDHCEHWDVQLRNRSHANISPLGEVHHGNTPKAGLL
jgi:hypothetical protein